MVFLSFKIVQFVLVSFSILKTLSYLYFCITFHKEGHQNQAQVQPRRAGTCPCKHSGVRPNNHSHTHAVAHAFTSPHILMSQRQCRICRGHSLSHLPFPSQFSQVGNPGASSSPGLRTDPITPSFTGSCPSDWGRFHQWEEGRQGS